MRRLSAIAGFLITSPLLLLGFAWPSVHTIAALIALPSPLIFIAVMIKPSLMDRRGLRAYLLLSAVLAIGCIALQYAWLAQLHEK